MDRMEPLYGILLLVLAILIIVAIMSFYQRIVKKSKEGKMVVFANMWDFALVIISCISLVVYLFWSDENMIVKYSLLAFSASCFTTSIVWSFLVNLNIKYGIYSVLVKFLTIILVIHIILLIGNFGEQRKTTKKVKKGGKWIDVPLTEEEQRKVDKEWKEKEEKYRQEYAKNKAVLLSIIGGTVLFKAALESHNANQEKTKQMIENGKTKKLVFTFLATFLLVFGYGYANITSAEDEVSKIEIHAQSDYQLSSDGLVSEKQLNTESTYVKDATPIKNVTPKTEIHAQSDYQLSSDGLVLEKWLNTESTHINMEGDVVLSKVTKIGEKAFQDLENIETVKFSNKLEHIGYNAFFGCVKLTAVTIPENVTFIGGDAFSVCYNLKTITFKGNRTELEHDIFYRALLDTIYVPAESIEWYKTSEYLGYYDEDGIIKPIK